MTRRASSPHGAVGTALATRRRRTRHVSTCRCTFSRSVESSVPDVVLEVLVGEVLPADVARVEELQQQPDDLEDLVARRAGSGG